MACKITIRKNINEIIDREIPEKMVYAESAVKQAVSKLNKIWGIKIASSMRGAIDGATLIKSSYGIDKVVDIEYSKQLKLEEKLSIPEGIKTAEPLINPEVQELFEQFQPDFVSLFNILTRYKSDSLGVINSDTIEEFTYTKLQQELNKEFGEVFKVRVTPSGSYYVSTNDSDNNVIEEEGKKLVNKAYSTSISDSSGVPSQVVKFANRLASRFKSRIKVISEKQAESYPTYRSGTQGFYDPQSRTSFIIYEKMKKVTALHEVFSHPFIIYIKQNHNGLYQTLLEKAKNNTEVKSTVDAYYNSYSPDAKDMEYISHAIDLEYKNQLQDPSLIKSIIRFWERIINFVKTSLGIKTDISKFSTIGEVLNFALNSREKLDLTNVELLDLQIMESFIQDNPDFDFANINEPSLEDRTSIDEIRKNIAPTVAKMHESMETIKKAIATGETELSNGEKEQLDTITARINILSKDLWKGQLTEDLLRKDKNLAITIQYFSGIIKNPSSSEEGLTEIETMLKSVANISQVMEEALVLTRYIKDQINKAQRSTKNIGLKQREIHQYHQVMQAIESSLKELYDFYIKTDNPNTEVINPVIEVINAIFGDIKNAKDIHSKYVIDFWAEAITNAVGPGSNKIIYEEINFIKGQLSRRFDKLRRADTEKRQEIVNKEISKLNLQLKKQEEALVTKENIKALINGDYGDSNYMYYKFSALMNNPNLLIHGVDRVIDEYFMSMNDETLKSVNRMQNIMNKYMEATGQTQADLFNVEKFSKQLIRKATYNEVKYITKIVNKQDPDTLETTEEQIYEQVLKKTEEDVILSKFMVQELNAMLKELFYYVTKARSENNSVELQKANLDYYNFRKKYFITPVTEEFDVRTINSDIITEEDIKGLYNIDGTPLSLQDDPNLAYAAKEVLFPLYDQDETYTSISISRVPTDTEIEEHEGIKIQMQAVASLVILGTTTKKQGKEMAIARAINRSRELKRGVFKYAPHPTAISKYRDRYIRAKDLIQKEVAAGYITLEEGRKELNKWHKMHSKLEFSKDYFALRNQSRTSIDEAFKELSEDDSFNFIEAFGYEERASSKKKTLDALWSEIYSLLNPLKDVERVVNGTLANRDLQLKIKEYIDLIDSYQSKSEALLKLTNHSQFERYFTDVKNMFIGNLAIDNFTSDKVATIRGKFSTVKYDQNGFNKLRQLLLDIPSARYEDETGQNDGAKFSDEQVKFIQSYLFKSTEYAEKFALIKKLELTSDEEIKELEARDKNAAIQRRKELLEEALEAELNTLLNEENTSSQYETYSGLDYNLEYQLVYTKLKTYGDKVSLLFRELSNLSERVTTSYYDISVKNLKTTLLRDNYEEAIEVFKKFADYSGKNEDEQRQLDDLIETINGNSLDKFKTVADFIDKKYKETDWYKDNHYKKLKHGIESYYETFPTPLWTQSKPTDDKYITIQPNNSYSIRSINEFLEDENGQPTNIRLKRGDTIISAKEGDTLELIAQLYNLSITEIKKMNPTLVGDLVEGDQIVVKQFGDRSFGKKEPREYLEDGTLSEYVDPEYRRLETQNPALIKVIDDINDINYEHQDKAGVTGLGFLQGMPRIEGIGWEVILDESGPTPKKIWRKVKNLGKIAEQDRDSGYGKADFSDMKAETIPLKFLSDIPYEARSRDVFGSLIKFFAHANEIYSLNQIFPMTDELHRIVDANSPAVKTEGRVKMRQIGFNMKKGIIIRERTGNTTGDAILHAKNSKLLNLKRQQLNIGNFSLTKFGDNVTAATSYGALSGIITPNIVMNYVIGKVQIWIEVWSGGIVNRSDYNNGIKRIYKYFFSDFNGDYYKLGNKSLMGQLLIRYNPNSKSLLELHGNELKRTPLKDYASFDVFFKTRRLSEFELSGGIVFAILDKYRVMDGNNEIALADAYELDSEGNLDLKKGLKKLDGSDFTREDENRIRAKCTQLNMIIQGNFSSHNKPQFDTTVFGPYVSFFRKHLATYAEKAYSTRHFNYALELHVEGYQRKLWATAITLAKAIKNRSKEDWDEALLEAKLDFNRDSTTKKGLIHNSILSMIYVLLAIVGSEDDDDKKKTKSYDSFIAKAMIYQLMRMKSDLELTSALPFIAGLNETLNVIKSPSIVVDRTITNLIKLTSHVIDYGEYKLGIIPEKEVVLKRDYYSFNKGDLKILKDLGVLTGLTGATFNPDQMVEKLQNINSALFR